MPAKAVTVTVLVPAIANARPVSGTGLGGPPATVVVLVVDAVVEVVVVDVDEAIVEVVVVAGFCVVVVGTNVVVVAGFNVVVGGLNVVVVVGLNVVVVVGLKVVVVAARSVVVVAVGVDVVVPLPAIVDVGELAVVVVTDTPPVLPTGGTLGPESGGVLALLLPPPHAARTALANPPTVVSLATLNNVSPDCKASAKRSRREILFEIL